MARRSLISFMVMGLVFVGMSGLHAKEVILEPQRVTVITSPTDERDARVLVYFEFPRELQGPHAEIDNAFLMFIAELTEADFGMLEVFPVKSDWKNAVSVSWSSPWDSVGGDYSKDVAGASMTLKREQGEKEIKLNVTLIVKAWLDGVFPNNGFAILPSQADLQNSSVKYALRGGNVRLKISY